MSDKNLKIDNDQAGRRIDNYLLNIFKDLPKSKIYSMLRKGEVRVNSGRIKPSYKLKINDEIRIPPYLIDFKNKKPNLKISPSSNLWERTNLNLWTKTLYRKFQIITIQIN